MRRGASGDGPVLGLVLCGGESRRMGRDKARVELGGRTLLERACGVLEPLCDEVLLASGPVPRYLEFGRLEVLDRRASGSGALAGVEAGLWTLRGRAADGWLLVLACDMPGVEEQLLARLLARARAEALDLLLLESERGPEPLAGVWSAAMLESVRAALDAGEAKMTAPERFATRRGTRPVCGRERVELACVRNLNTPADLEGARA